MKYIKQFIYISDRDSTYSAEIKRIERFTLLDIFRYCVYFGVATYWVILINDDIMNMVYNAMMSDLENELLIGIEIITEILTEVQNININEYPMNFIWRLLHWKEGLMIEGVCRFFGLYEEIKLFEI